MDHGHEHHYERLTTEEQEAVRDLEAFLQGLPGIPEEVVRSRLEGLTPPAWARVQNVLRNEVGAALEGQRAWEEHLEHLERLKP